MDKLRHFREFCAVVILVAAPILPCSLARGNPVIVFTGARLIDGTGRPAIENGALVIDGDRIIAAGKIDPAPYAAKIGAQVIQCDGETIMPSVISDHSHLGVVKDDNISAANFTIENIQPALRQYEDCIVLCVGCGCSVCRNPFQPKPSAQNNAF